MVESKECEEASEPCHEEAATKVEETQVKVEEPEKPPEVQESEVLTTSGGGTLESPCQPASAKWGEIVRLQERVAQLEEENSELRQQKEKEVAENDVKREVVDGECQTAPKDDTNTLSMGTQVEDLSKQGGDGDTPDVEQRLKEVAEERDRLEREVERLRGRRTASPDEISSESPEPSEQRINHLIMVKERYDDVSRTNGELERSLRELETEVESLWSQNQVATACAALPIVVLLLAFIVAYLPTLSSLFGTAEQPS